MIDAIVFDFDGVIVDSEPLHFQAFVQVLEALGSRIDYELYLKHALGRDDRGGFRELCENLGIPFDEQRLSELVLAKASNMTRIIKTGVSALPGALELVADCAAAVPVALCSGALRSDIEAILPVVGGGGLRAMFRTVVSADDVLRSKPHPEPYLLATSNLGVSPGSCLSIEDTPAGIHSALDAGLRTLAVTTTCPTAELYEAEHVVPSLSELTFAGLQAHFC